jgi:hypothetical protein
METGPTGAARAQAASNSGLPDDFPQRIATKIVVTTERERDPDVALQKIAVLVMRNLAVQERHPYFIEAMEKLLEDDEAQRYASLTYTALSLNPETHPRHEHFLNEVLDCMVDDHMNVAKPPITLEGSRKTFSAYARHLGEVFINMIDMNSDLYETISYLFSTVIRKEMAIEQEVQREGREGGRRVTLATRDAPKAAKKLFDETVDYIHARGEFHSDSLNQQNPNEFMGLLADRMRGTRRYVIQDIINKQALAKKKEVEKELSERLANAEDVILAKDSFKKALNLFWTEKLYNFKYLSVEKVRVTVQVIAIIVGVGYFLMGYLGLYSFMWWEGLIVAAAMYIYARFLCSRRAFRKFFPDDVSKELEVVVGSFTPTIRRMSKDQMDAFLVRQVRDPANLELLPILSEFVKYVFAVMPDRKSAIIALEELSEIMENIELDIARTVRASASHRAPF